MEFQPTPGTYTAVDPFVPSISFSIKKILGSQRAPEDDTDLNSPPPTRVATSTWRHSAIRPPTVGPRYEAPPNPWIPTASSIVRLPPPHARTRSEPLPDNRIPYSPIRLPPQAPHELRTPRSEPLPDNWIPYSPIRLPPQPEAPLELRAPRSEPLPNNWIPYSPIRLPPQAPLELRTPRSEPLRDNWIPCQTSDSPIRLPLPHDYHHVQGDLQSHWSSRPHAARIEATSTISRQRNTSPYQNSESRSRHRSKSSSPSDRNRGRRRGRSPPLILRDSSPQFSSSRANEQLRQKRNSRSRHQSRSSSPSVERKRIREKSPSQHRQHSRSRSKSPVRSRSRSRSTRRSRSSSSGSDGRAPMVLIPESSSKSNSAIPRLVRTGFPPPIITPPSSWVPELAPLSSSSPSSTNIQHSFTSRRSRSASPPSIIPPHSPILISIEPPESPPLSSLFSTDSSAAADGMLCSPTQNSQPPLPGPEILTPYPSVPSIYSIPSPTAEETDVRNSIMPPPNEFHCSPPIGFRLPEKSDTLSSGSCRQGAVNLSSEPFDVKRPVGRQNPPEPAHLMTYVAAFALDTLPRQLYLHFLLRLPYMYFSRVTRIFEEADMSMPQIKQGILEAAIQLKEPVKGIADAWKLEPVENVQYFKLQNTWQSFIDSLIREWKTLNIISVLLLSAILTILQIENAANDPLTRYSALLSMVCALMSLFYGCIYIIRFGTMRKTYKAAEWAQVSRTSRTGIFWNVWVLLAMPATWLAWSMIMYIVCIMSLVWRTGTTDDANRGPMTPEDAFAFRIIVTIVLALGLIYFVLIASTLRRYGEMMDQAWHRRIVGWINDTVAPVPYSVAGSRHIPTTPIPLVDPPTEYQTPDESGSGPTSNVYSTDRTYPESKSPTISGKSSSARSYIPHSYSEVPAAFSGLPTRGATAYAKSSMPVKAGGSSSSNPTDQEYVPPEQTPPIRYSNLDQNPPPRPVEPSGRSPSPLNRSVRWTENLINPSPVPSRQRRKGWFNRRGDQLWTNDGVYKPPSAGEEYPLEFDNYPEYGDGWMNEENTRIDMYHRLIPKPPLRSALKQTK